MSTLVRRLLILLLASTSTVSWSQDADLSLGFLQSGPDVVLSACRPKGSPLRCSNAKLLRKSPLSRLVDNNDPTHKFTYQEFWYDGMDAAYRDNTTVRLRVTNNHWVLPVGVQIGMTEEEVHTRLKFLAKARENSDGTTLEHCKNEDCVLFDFAGSPKKLREVQWFFYYD
jgi:hypothetical protein